MSAVLAMLLSALVLVTAGAGAGAAGAVGDPAPVTSWLDAYDERHQSGNLITYQDSASSLGGWNDIIRSTCLNGFWVFYEHDQFNYLPGKVQWAYGFDYCLTFYMDLDRQVSSVRRVGIISDAAAASLSLYGGTFFSGGERFITEYDYNVTTKYGYRSVIVSGPDAWTIFSGDNYTGSRLCLYSGGESTVSPSGQKIQYGLFPTVEDLGIVGSSIRSARKGCFSHVKLRGEGPGPANHLSSFMNDDEKNEDEKAGKV